MGCADSKAAVVSVVKSKPRDPENKTTSDFTEESPAENLEEVEQAAIKIQAAFRGHLVRKEVHQKDEDDNRLPPAAANNE